MASEHHRYAPPPRRAPQRRAPQRRAAQPDAWPDPPQLGQVLYPDNPYADADAVGYRHDHAPFDEHGSAPVDEYREPDDYFDEEPGPYYEAYPGSAQALNGAPQPVLGQHDYEYGDEEDPELYYDDYFDDDDGDDLVDQTSAVTRNALEWAVVLVGAVLVALLLRAVLFQAFYIPSESMEDTLVVNDRVLVNKVSYRLHDIHRGDIVVFARPEGQDSDIKDLIKRVIALPGETIEARDNVLYINDQQLIEPYIDPGTITSDFGPTVVPEGEVFVMGDNRGESFDSRGFGPIEADSVIGRAFVLFWPISRIGSL